MSSVFRSAAATALAISIAMPAAAQTRSAVQTDARWQAWLGCWTPTGTLIRVVGKTPPSAVCVVPASSSSAVDVMTVASGKVVDSMHVDADGQPHTIAKDGCTGWHTAKWSPSARRVYLKSEYTCKGRPATKVSAIYAMAGSGTWVDVQGMRVEKSSAVHAVRYREAAGESDLPAAITSKLSERTFSRMTAMLAATETPTIADVEEASREVDPNVVSTWLIETDKASTTEPVPLSGKELVQLSDHGVPGSVIDVMVGLSYPNVLIVNPDNGGVARQNRDSAYSQYGYMNSLAAADPIIGFDRFGFPIYASQSTLLQGCSPWLYGPYDVGWNMYASQFGCGGLGYAGYPGYAYGGIPYYGYGGYYGGYFGGGPVVVPRGGGTAAAVPPHGHVVNGHGYSQGGNPSGGTAMPRSTSMGSSGSAPPPPPARTAVPKKP
jgi:hypothetical protein